MGYSTSVRITLVRIYDLNVCMFVCLFVTEEILYSVMAGSDQGSNLS